MLSSLVGLLAKPIVEGVLKGIAERQKAQQFEEMQAEVLEGWIFKIVVAVERELHAAGVPVKIYDKVFEAIKKVVEEEVDTKKL